MTRSMSYMAVANSCMLLFLLVKNLELSIDLRLWGAPIIVSIILLMALFGYLEDKLGLWREELRITHTRNSELQRIGREVEEIKKMLGGKVENRHRDGRDR